jgi:hypothetical protein
MGTNNFYNKNATRVYVVLESYETPILDENGNETDELETVCPDSFDYDLLTEYVADVLLEKSTAKGVKFHQFDKKNSCYDNRNFGASYLASIFKRYVYCGIEFDLTLNAFIRGGYYEAANLDWEVELSFEGNRYDDDEDFVLAYDDFEDKRGVLKMNIQNINNKINKIKNELVDICEDCFETVSTPYLKVGTFSNGETVYKKS